MGRRLRSSQRNPSESDPWIGAHQKNFGSAFLIEIVGFNSPTQTVFVRALNLPKENQAELDDKYSRFTLGNLVSFVVDEWKNLREKQLDQSNEEQGLNLDFASSDDLIRLGAVWVLNECRPGEVSKPRRVCEKDSFEEFEWSIVTVRIHLVPGRFPAAYQYHWSKYYCGPSSGTEQLQGFEQYNRPDVTIESSKNGAIIYENENLGFAILNKPGLLPSHPTVSNAYENALSMYREALWKRSIGKGPDDQKSCIGLNASLDIYLSLPQRLDTETSGLLIVATKKEFSSYMANLLEKKTTTSILGLDREEVLVGKKYKCLVHTGNNNMKNSLKRRKNEVITHYIDQASSAPKTFTSNPSSDKNWLECKMKLTSIQDKFSMSTGPDSDAFLEVEIELLTGRTHQIRGQMAALGHPLVGDPLYGKEQGEMIQRTRKNADLMALQCSEISFPTPEWKFDEKKRIKRLYPTQNISLFNLQSAWWDNSFQTNHSDNKETIL